MSPDATVALDRRAVVLGAVGVAAAGCLSVRADADVPVPYDWNAAPPTDDQSAFIAWMVGNRGEHPGLLGKRWDRFKRAVANRDLPVVQALTLLVGGLYVGLNLLADVITILVTPKLRTSLQ